MTVTTTTRIQIGAAATLARLTKPDVEEGRDLRKNWGKWGLDDLLGVLNYVTPEDVVNAAKLVRYVRSSGSVSISTRTAAALLFGGR